MKDTIAKRDWLRAQQCRAMAWYQLRAGPENPTEAELFRMEQGREIGELARKLYPGGILLSSIAGKTSAQITQEQIADGTKQTFFEATVLAAPFVAKADILARQNRKWHVLEVRSSFADSNRIKEFIDDLAYTVMVFKRAGLPVRRASLVLLSRAYRLGDGPDRLFEVVDQTGEVLSRVAEFEGAAAALATALFYETRPVPLLVPACRKCDFFVDPCLGAGLARTVLELPALHSTKLGRLSTAGIIELSRVPADLGLNERQERVKNVSLSGKPFVDPALRQALKVIVWPCHYLDFETVTTFLPLYAGQHCHQQVTTQFSIHHRDGMKTELRHSEYLADPSRDCERELATALIGALGKHGSVIVYTNFEQILITKLRYKFLDLAAPLEAILGRLVDLCDIIRDNVYHPAFKGSFSIKNVLPALVPNLSYKDLPIGDGDTAMSRFARMARGQVTGVDIERTRSELLEYCKLDTLAMARLHEALSRMAA